MYPIRLVQTRQNGTQQSLIVSNVQGVAQNVISRFSVLNGTSLTTIIKDHRIKELIIKHFDFKTLDIEAEIRAPPITKRYAKVGTAFDYLARWWLEREYGVTVSGSWVAEHGAGKIMVRCGTHARVRVGGTTTYVPVDQTGPIRLGSGDSIMRDGDPDPSLMPLASAAAATIAESKAAYHDWISTGVATDDLFACSLKLAGLDSAFRANVFDKDGAAISGGDIDDLRGLWAVMKDGDLAALEEPISLNPTFGKASRMVGGADADIVAGGTLIDIKTTKKPKLDRRHFDQLAGYYALAAIGGIDGMDKFGVSGSPIDKLGIYFSRHGRLCAFSVDDLAKGDLGEFVADFEKLVGKIRAPVKRAAASYHKSPLHSGQK